MVRALINRVLTDEGYEVVSVADGVACMSHDGAPPTPNPHPGPLERSYALQCASQGLQAYARELRRQSDLALEESRHLRAQLAPLLSRSRPLALALILSIP